MAKVIVIKTSGDLDHAIKSLNRIKRRLPEMTRIGMRRWGKILTRDMKLSARKSNIKDFSAMPSLFMHDDLLSRRDD